MEYAMSYSTCSTNWKKRCFFLIFQLFLVLALSNIASGATASIPVSETKGPATVKAVDYKNSSGQAKTTLTVNNPPTLKEEPSTQREYNSGQVKIKTTYEYDQLGRLIRKKTVVSDNTPQ